MTLQRRSAGTATALTGRKSRVAGTTTTISKLWKRTAGAAVLVADWSAPPPVVAGPTFVASAAATPGFSATSVVPAIASTQAGDVLVTVAAGNFNADTITAPAGLTWTLLASTNAIGGGRLHVLVAVATGPLASTTWTWPASHNHAVGIVAYRGAAVPSAAAVAAPASAVSTIDAPSRTTTVADSVLLCAGYHAASGTTAAFPGSMTNRVNTATATPGLVVASEPIATPSTTGVRTYTVSPGNTTLFAASVALAPA